MLAAFDQLGASDWLATGLLGLALAWICVVDIRRFEIPDAASLGLVATGLAFSFVSPLVTPAMAAAGTGLGYAVFALMGAVFYRATGQDGLGLGDAKLLAAAGAWLGLRDLPTVVAVASVSALVFACLTRQRRLAFGPWLAGAFWVLWVVRISA